MSKVSITENLKNEIVSIIKEMLDPNSEITIKTTNQQQGYNSNPVKALSDVTKAMKTQGISPNKPGVHISADANINGTEMNIIGTPKKQQNTNLTLESIIINKKQLIEARLKKMKQGSTVVKLKDFIK